MVAEQMQASQIQERDAIEILKTLKMSRTKETIGLMLVQR